MVVSLHDFLKSKKTKDIVNKKDYGHIVYYMFFIKIQSGIDRLSLIYRTESTNKNTINPFEQIELVGIYDKEKEILYNVFYFEFTQIDISNIKIIRLEDLKKEIYEKVIKEIQYKIGYNKDVLDVNKDDIKPISEEDIIRTAYALFMNSKEINKYNYTSLYKLPEIKYSEDLFLLYLNNPIRTIRSEVEKYIEKEKIYIFNYIRESKLIEEELKKMSKNKTLIEYKKIFSILNDKSRKTVNIEFLKNGKTNKYKVVTNYSCTDKYIDEYDIIGSKDRQNFNDLFTDKETKKVYFDDITKITYNRNILYEKVS